MQFDDLPSILDASDIINFRQSLLGEYFLTF